MISVAGLILSAQTAFRVFLRPSSTKLFFSVVLFFRAFESSFLVFVASSTLFVIFLYVFVPSRTAFCLLSVSIPFSYAYYPSLRFMSAY